MPSRVHVLPRIDDAVVFSTGQLRGIRTAAAHNNIAGLLRACVSDVMAREVCML